MIQNLHSHTTFCDGKNTPEEMVRAGVALASYRAEVLRVREEYAGQLEAFLGIERDWFWAPDGGDWDYVIGSVHYVEKDGTYLGVDHSEEIFLQNVERHYGGDFYAFAQDYYRLVGEIPERTGCQIVGHFDLISKFNEGDKLFDTGHPRYVDAAMAALDRLAGKDVICEINTGAMSRGYRSAPYPAPALLRAMRERNIPICITGDSHNVAALLHAFPQAAELARSCGYREQMALTRRGFEPAAL